MPLLAAHDIRSAGQADATERHPAGVKPRALTREVVLLAVLATSTLYVGWNLNEGWMPYDDGALAHGAERLLLGELPHRDFDEIYTGGLAWLNAAAFRVVGHSLLVLRLVLFAVFIAWVPVVFAIASRFVKPLAAGGITLLAVAWSLPNYTAAMPSWYNLFLATFGLAALLRHLEDPRARWLVVAGVAGGLSFLVKVIGLYYVAGVLLYLVFHAHASARATALAAAGPHPRRGPAYSVLVTAALGIFIAALLSVVWRQRTAPDLVHFVMPAVLIVAMLLRDEWTLPAGGSRDRFTGLARLILPFVLGVALPVAIFLVPYARSGTLGAFVYGVLVLPTKRFGMAAVSPESLATMLTLVPLALLALWATRGREHSRAWATPAIAIGCVVAIAAAARWNVLGAMVWLSLRSLFPALAAIGVLVLARRRAADAASPLLRAQCVLLLAVTSLCYLVQFPYAVPFYFCYVAPLVFLSAVALGRYLPPMRPAVPAAVVAFYLAFAVLRVNGSALSEMGRTTGPRYHATVPLGLARTGLRVPAVHAEVYRELVWRLRRHARGGYTWGSPDMPELYVLTGLRNPTRTMFDFFDDTTGRTARTLDALDSRGVTAIVLNRRPGFSAAPSAELVESLESRYPYSTEVGPFHLRWRQ